jgi:hypothetical protein
MGTTMEEIYSLGLKRLPWVVCEGIIVKKVKV